MKAKITQIARESLGGKKHKEIIQHRALPMLYIGVPTHMAYLGSTVKNGGKLLGTILFLVMVNEYLWNGSL